ncbi:MAG TPA: ribulokinase [Deinococcales bacterium]|nr:ribulokinase [Deinococcales bacterium]
MSNLSEQYLVGVDFGTESGRAVVVRASDGRELGSAVTAYPHGVIDRSLPGGPALPPEWALQDPRDYLVVFQTAVPQALQAAGVPAGRVAGIGIDFTASTVLPVKADGTPLCDLPEFAQNPHAFVKLWKHHSAQGQADRINALAAARGEPWLARYGNLLSSEWMLAKALQTLEEAPEVYAAADRLIEAADWVVWQLCGQETRNACTLGYKAVYQDGVFPDRDYLSALNPDFAGVIDDKIRGPVRQLGELAGRLTRQAAAWTGLPEGIAVAAANVDAHVSVPAARVTGPGRMVMAMGTSTCHMVIGEHLADVPGMCGVVDGGIIPGLYGYEAGQSGVGDIFAWFVKHAVPAYEAEAAEAAGLSLHDHLTRQAARQEPGEHGLVALDWWNGNRSVLVNTHLSGLILGLTLNTRAADIYRALIEATAYGTREIIDAFEASGVPVRELIVAGGLKKNPLVMQIYADVTGRPLSLVGSDQGAALGSAMHAAVAAGLYEDIQSAAGAMGQLIENAYRPIPAHQATYERLYAEYATLHDYFGRGGNDVMFRLKALRDEARANHSAGERAGKESERA